MLKFKRGQIWGTDLIIATTIFFTALLIFYNYSVNLPVTSDSSIGNMLKEGVAVSNSILSEGYPPSWDLSNALRIGILNEKEISNLKLQYALNLAQNNYTKAKALLGTKFDFYFFLSTNQTIFINQTAGVEGIGKAGVNSTNIQDIGAKNLVKISRLSIYQEKPVKLTLYLWR